MNDFRDTDEGTDIQHETAEVVEGPPTEVILDFNLEEVKKDPSFAVQIIWEIIKMEKEGRHPQILPLTDRITGKAVTDKYQLWAEWERANV